MNRFLLFLVILVTSTTSYAAIDLTTVVGWSTVLQGADLDHGNDQQATASIDLLGDASHPMFYMEFDDLSDADPSNDEVAFSFRGDKVVDNQGDFKGYLWIGLDFDNDGVIDSFMVLKGDGTASGQTLTIFDSDSSKANNSPSTTSLLTATATSVTTGFTFYHDVAPDNSDLDIDGDTDYIVSYKINFQALATALNATNLSTTGLALSTLDSGNGVGLNTPFKLVVSSAQQVNSLNGDLGGYDAADSDGATLYTVKGAYTPTVTFEDPSPFDAAQTTITASPTSVAADGVTTSTITVQAKDSVGDNLTSSAGTLVLSQDGSASISSVTDNNDGTYTATISDTVVETVTISGSVDGIDITDTASVSFTDITPPTVSINGAPTAINNSTFNVTFQFSEDVIGFALGDISVGNGSASSFIVTDANTYTADITPDGSGDMTIDVAANVAQDGAGNNNTAASQVVVLYDVIAPTVDIQGEPVVVNTTSPFNVTVEFSEDVTGFIQSDVSVGNGSVTGFTAVDGNTYTVQITPDGTGIITIDIAASVAQDAAGNNNTSATQAIISYDVVSPMVDIQNEPAVVNSTSPFNVTFEFSENVTGFTIGDIAVGNGSASNFNTTDANTYTADITPNGVGNITIDIAANVAQDGSANGNTAATQAVITFDDVPPSVDIQNEPVIVNTTAAFNVTFKFSESVTGFVPGDISVMNASVSNFAGSGDTYTADITPSGAGNVTIDVAAAVAQDAASNNNTAAAQAVITFDNVVPVVSINTPSTANSATSASYGVSGSCSTGDGNVNVAITSATPTSQSVACSSGSFGASFNVSAITDGSNALNISASQTDAAGNTGNDTAQADKDTVVPTVDIQNEPVSVNSTAAFNVTIKFSESVTNFVSGDVIVANASVSNFTGSGDTYTAEVTPSSAGNITIDVTASVAQDSAGNNNTAAAQAIVTFDNVAPVVSIASPVTANATNTSSYPVSGSCTNGDGNVTVMITSASPANQSVACGSGSFTANFDLSAVADGSNTINISASQTDAAGNTGNDIAQADKDSTQPTVDIQGEPASSALIAFNITVKFSENVSGFQSTDIAVGNGSVTGFAGVNGSTYSVYITPNGGGNITIDIAADVVSDSVGNGNIAAPQAVVTLINDSDADGIPDSVECPSGPPYDSTCQDSNGDSIPDFQQSDSDGDGISDSAEAGTDAGNPVDSDGDGIPDYQDSDSDNDGIDDLLEGVTDTDGDGIPDYVDVAGTDDSDGDGIPDIVECTAYPGCEDSDGDGTPDYMDTDADNDGINDSVEAGTNPTQPIDTDGDGIPDYQDTDSDNDGADDSAEGTADVDSDGIPDYVDAQTAGPGAGDSDGDGIADNIECVMYPFCADSDSDGIPDYMETDSDNDGILDIDESGSSGNDADNDGIDDAFDIDLTGGVDLDNNGVDDHLPLDTDGDGMPDYQDTDSDNDGISDAVEGIIDTDNDGIPDYLDVSNGDASGTDITGSGDSDGDGVSDADECPAGIPCLDTDGDGVPDYMDALAIDGPLADADNDGVLNYLDPDDDNDSIPDVVEDPNTDADNDPASNALDSDLDGIPDYLDTDSDNDGLSDAKESGSTGNDTDGDNIDDRYDVDITGGTDANSDGIDDAIKPVDSDGDGLPDYLDTINDATATDDSDNDGIPNNQECPDFPTNCPDSDNDGTPDYLETDSDNDGLPDNEETGLLESGALLDTDGDGIPDYQDTDSDNDGVDDAVEGLDNDSDGDGIPDAVDADSSGSAYGGDSDGDGVEDAAECPNYPACADSDNDGTPDYMDPAAHPYNPNATVSTGLNGFGGLGPWVLLMLIPLGLTRKLVQKPAEESHSVDRIH